MNSALNNLQIERCLRRHGRTRRFFRGCFPLDELPRGLLAPYALIANLDKAGEPGSHWVALVVGESQSVEYFDSFGDGPPPLILEFMKNFAKAVVNRTSLQSAFSSVCGHYCIYYVLRRALGVKCDKVVHELKEMRDPDSYVRKAYEALKGI